MPLHFFGDFLDGVGAPKFWCPGTRTLVPFQVENRFFVLISRMGFRNINFSFFLSVFMCSGHFLVLSEHCQHKCENTIKKTPKKNVGAPEFWCPGTRTLVPPMFLTVWLGQIVFFGGNISLSQPALILANFYPQRDVLILIGFNLSYECTPMC